MQLFPLLLSFSSIIFVQRMKRLGVILFTAFYLMVSLGVNLNLHYCGGKLASIGIELPANNCCCGQENSNSCCSDASVSMEMDVDQQVTYPPSLDVKLTNISIKNWIELYPANTSIHKEILPLFPNPPPLKSADLRLQMGSLTFYG